MRLVFKEEEVAAALGKTLDEFVDLRSKLETFGFPKPLRGLDDSWSIMEVINWVNNVPQTDEIAQ
jgi:hypothetical protein